MTEIREYQTREGKRPLSEWLDTLRDRSARARVLARIDRLSIGLRGNWKSVGRGVFELRIDHGLGYRIYCAAEGAEIVILLCGATSADNDRTSRRLMSTGKTTKHAAPSVPFRVADHLRSERDIAAYLEAVLEDGDPRAMPVALRTVADALGGLAVLAERTGLSRETLYRTLSEKGNPRYDTLTSILGAFGLRVSVAPRRRGRPPSSQRRVA
jgi:putative addiction module killer protein/probable addiction module antidote protein